MEWYIALFTCKTTADYIKCITCRHYIGVGTGGGHRGHVPPQVFSPCYVRSTKIKLCPPINKSSLYVLTIADFKHKYIYNISLPLLYLSYVPCSTHTTQTRIYTPVVLQVRQHPYLQYWTGSTVFENVLHLTIPGENTQTR